ncbi:glycosyltransferase [Sodalinema gerasimenkoae]|uniref:glycosyltransferase n=1 Tax=Sodalinema gerasimenkoae TaxID=2862348 RepID=UPI0013568B81|nr:glycosyltransferase [Sodalinema gerasimenkoae]
MKLVVEGWRFVHHSFAVANQHQLLEFLRRPQIQVFHRELPYLDHTWQPQAGLFTEAEEQQLRQIPPPPLHLRADATLRMVMPYDLSDSDSQRTYVFATTEWRIVQKAMMEMMGVEDFGQAHRDSETVIITPSHWSRDGFLRAGAVPERVRVVPLGVDTAVFHPATAAQRQRWRQQSQLEGCFAFLNIGVMTWNKGLRMLVKAFAEVTQRYPQARLVLKGSDAIRNSRKFVLEGLNEMLTPQERDRVIPRLAYIGRSLSTQELAQLYQTCDAYISPYLAEGFNMPVLEAAASGLPILCTQGGSTDDFTDRRFTRYIDSELKQVEWDHEIRDYLHPSLEHTVALMSQLIETPSFIEQARRTAPEWVQQGFTWQQIVDRLLGVMDS